MAKRAAKKKYDMPDPLPQGELLEDAAKKQWKLGSSIGKGGFGEIYSAQEVGSSGYKYVVKIEPHENGPLFVEMHMYMKIGKPEDVEEYRKNKKLKCLGMPVCYGRGSHESDGKKYRFLVMDKFETDLEKILKQNNGKFPEITVYQLGLQILDALEYMHTKGYIHADIKAANLLLPSSKKQVYLVDFGLAARYKTDQAFKADPKKAHNGTIEYLSRDAHYGVETRRGDLEILAYNMIYWLGCKLPWEKDIKDPKAVQKSKEEHMNNVPKFMKSCFGKDSPPDPIVKYLEYINNLQFNSDPDYNKIRDIFSKGIKALGGKPNSDLTFKPSSSTPAKKNRVATPQRAPTVEKTPTKRNGHAPLSPTPEKRTRRAPPIDYSESPQEPPSKTKKRAAGLKTNQRKRGNRVGEAGVNGVAESGKKAKGREEKEADALQNGVKDGDSSDGEGEVMTAAMKEILQKKKENERIKKRLMKPSTSKGKGKVPVVPKTHQDVVGCQNGNSSSDEEEEASKVSKRRK